MVKMRMAISLSARKFSTFASHPMRVCVVGSGPAGFYTAEKLLKTHEGAQVDIIDRLPTPFGLVRSGVAPDHQETKVVVNQFSRVAVSERCSFFGNVCLGTSVSLSELRDLYHVVVLSFGAESDRVLGIPGEDLKGIYAAREFVWWYNGHPDCRKLSPVLKSTDSAVILGQGNVALDIARILLRPTSELSTTDIASHALEALEESSIRKVYLVGRRGPVQAACTAKELREVLGIKNLYVNIQKDDLRVTPTDEVEMKNSRINRRIYELLSKAAQSGTQSAAPGQRELHFVFFRKPESFLASNVGGSKVVGVKLEKTMLNQRDGPGKQIAVGTGEYAHIDSGMVLKSIGYKSIPVDGLPFDHRKGVVPNIKGRVLGNNVDGSPHPQPGLYVCGWLKRGPTGIIATNLYCAEETVASITEDLEQGSLPSPLKLPKPGREGLSQLLKSRNVRLVPFSGWEKIDAEERRLGSLKNKPREKLASWEELLEIANQ
uniref:NADPH:adrenodoxin oxidoreductase, mitochondrial n=1 Tax=Kalanchoe fedtschenkoi TaxID=63787 RepID=A0A7N0RE99_KALFE